MRQPPTLEQGYNMYLAAAGTRAISQADFVILWVGLDFPERAYWVEQCARGNGEFLAEVRLMAQQLSAQGPQSDSIPPPQIRQKIAAIIDEP
jgi:hypothetical protein